MENRDLIENPFVVFGPSKSGTTWLQKIIDAHPKVRCHFQLPLVPFARDRVPQFKTFRDEPRQVFSQNQSPFKGLFQSNEEEAKYITTKRQLDNFFLALYRVQDEMASMTGMSPQVLDDNYKLVMKSINTSFLLDNSEKVFFGTKAHTDFEKFFEIYPNGKAILIIRDGRDVCVSRRIHQIKKGIFYHGDAVNGYVNLLTTVNLVRRIAIRLMMIGPNSFKREKNNHNIFSLNSLRANAIYWTAVTEYLLESNQRYASKMLLIKYEDLKFDFDNTVRKIFIHLDAPFNSDILAQIKRDTDFEKLKGNDKDSFFRKGQVGDWENFFTKELLEEFSQIAGNTMHRAGYSVSKLEIGNNN